jgi:hypothetical protein
MLLVCSASRASSFHCFSLPPWCESGCASAAQRPNPETAPATSQGQGVAAQPGATGTKNDDAAKDHGSDAHSAGESHGGAGDAHGAAGAHGADHGGAHGKDHDKPKSAFTPHAGSWFNPIARSIFGQDAPQAVKDDHTPYKAGEKRGNEVHYTNVEYDYIVIAYFVMAVLGILALLASRRASIRPEGKPHSLANSMEAAVEGLQNYLVGVMGESLARKYAPLIASFFSPFCFFNYSGLIPGFIAPTSNPNVPFALGAVRLLMVHIIAIKETRLQSVVHALCRASRCGWRR